MDTYQVGLTEGFSYGVYSIKSAICRVEGIYAVLRRTACVGGFTLIDYTLGNTANVAFIYNEGFRGGCVYHKRKVNAVKVTSAEELGFASEVLDFSFFPKLRSVFNFQKLLSGNGAKAYSAREAI